MLGLISPIDVIFLAACHFMSIVFHSLSRTILKFAVEIGFVYMTFSLKLAYCTNVMDWSLVTKSGILHLWL